MGSNENESCLCIYFQPNNLGEVRCILHRFNYSAVPLNLSEQFVLVYYGFLMALLCTNRCFIGVLSGGEIIVWQEANV